MASFAAALLDELMGRNRNADPTHKGKDIEWSDPEVCKFYLCGFCPHELFTNTRADLGNCDKIHDDELAKNYKKSSRCMRMGYEEEFLAFLQNLIAEVDRRIRRGHQRLALNAAHSNQVPVPGVQDEKIQMLSERINELVEQAESLGCEGRVEEAQGVLKLCDQLKEERTALQEAAKNNPNQMTPKEMEVCPICGAFLVVGDAQQRVEEHLSGKQHMGYAKVRSTIESIKKKLRGEDPEREARLAMERVEREKEKEKEREREKEKDKERERERERRREEEEADRKRRERRDERNHGSGSGSRKRSRSRSRHKKRSRSRSHDRHHRSKESSHKTHHRSRSRSPGHRHSSRDERNLDRTTSSRERRRDRQSEDRVKRNGDSTSDRSHRTDIDGTKSGDSV